MKGTREDPWVLTTPSGGSEFTAFRDESADPPALVCQVGKTEMLGLAKVEHQPRNNRMRAL